MMTTPSAWPDWLEHVWAKSPQKEAEQGESLAQHTWEVLARLADLVRLRPGLPDLCGGPRLWHLLFWVVFIHDWGKVARGFQARLRGGPRWNHRHEVLSLAFLNWLTAGFEEEEATWVAAAIASHHRDASELWFSYDPTYQYEPSEDPVYTLIKELEEVTVRGLWHWLHEAAANWVQTLGLDESGVSVPSCPPEDEAVSKVMTQGWESIYRWLRRYRRLVRDLEDLNPGEEKALTISTLLLRGYLIQADHVASAHAGPLPRPAFSMDGILHATGLPRESLYNHQRLASQTEGSALLVAPTGSGKTEAALLWAGRQAELEGQLPRLFYTLPYQASMNAMYDRLKKLFSDKQVGLLHGRSTLALYRRFMEQEYTPEEAAQQARWGRNLAALPYYPVRVFSPYQMLKATYQLKGYEAMLADYALGAFIFDEIHAYEASRLALILETVRYLRERFGARFFVMSATFPGPIRCCLEEAVGKLTSITASPDLFQKFARHQVHLLEGDLLQKAGLARVEDAFRAGQSVLLTCNTVARAQEAYKTLKARFPDVPPENIILVHGRFTGRDRIQKEQRIIEATGLDSARHRPVLVISTQVVEVSLNIDLDTIFSDPAPLEALVQRFGRVNRKRRVALAPVHVFIAPDDGQGIYDGRLVQGALRVLETYAEGRPIDETAVQDWLDEIYTGEALSEWEVEYRKTAQDFQAAFLESLRPFNANSRLESQFDKLFDRLEVLPLALKGEFDALRKERPIEATQLLVPISWKRYHMLRQAQRVHSGKDEWPQVVDAPYSPEKGLSFENM